MLTVNIPEQARALLERLATMPEEHFEALRSALSAASPNLRLNIFNRQVKSLLSGKAPELSDLVGVITGLSRSPRDESVGVNELAASVAAEVLKNKASGNPDPNPGSVLLVARLVILLGIQSLKLWAKASNVQHQYGEIFADARIISDIRPVFEPEGTTPMGAMVVHNLKMSSTDGRGELRERFFALDSADLDILQAVIQRAKDKTASLDQIIERSNLTYFHSE
ncbi:MAG: hypothetical protein ABI824_10400 [Acidobacteriota bacterium]